VELPFEVRLNGQRIGEIRWPLIGHHNANNALAAIAAARQAEVRAPLACEALAQFKNVKRRLEPIAVLDSITVYDDFAHHPTAIRTTLEALRQRVGAARIIAIFEPRSNTMRMGIHRDQLAPAFALADLTLLYSPPDLPWDLAQCTKPLGEKRRVFKDINAIVEYVSALKHPGGHIVINE
jgi:UDP-N-acetylmuramate: L-alanyl-gamma-D-glutamyl-meso-diaminopimelate ligase